MVGSNPGTGDYAHVHHGQLFDDGGPAIWALIQGRFGDLPSVQPLMGLVSIVLRAPFAALGHATGGLSGEYRFGAFACVWALAALAVALGLSGRRPVARLAAPLLILATATTTGALAAGHPEELLLAALAVAGVWSVAAGRVTVGAVLVGLAIGTKPFGFFALGAALLAAPGATRRLLVVAGAVAAVTVLPLPLASPHTYHELASQLAQYKRVLSDSLWWALADEHVLRVPTGAALPELHTIRVMPDGLDRGSGTLVGAGFAAAALVVAWLRRGNAMGYDALAVLAICLLARSAFDPFNLEYYAAPALVTLVAWEVLAHRRAPLVSAIAVAFYWLTFHTGLGHASLQATLFAAWSLCLFAYLLVTIARRPHRIA